MPGKTNHHQPQKLRPGPAERPRTPKTSPGDIPIIYRDRPRLPSPCGPACQKRPRLPPPRVHAGRPAGDQHQPPRTPGRSTSQGSTSPGPVALPEIRAAHQPGQTDSTSGPRWTAPPGPAPTVARAPRSPAAHRRPVAPSPEIGPSSTPEALPPGSPAEIGPGPAQATKRTKNSP